MTPASRIGHGKIPCPWDRTRALTTIGLMDHRSVNPLGDTNRSGRERSTALGTGRGDHGRGVKTIENFDFGGPCGAARSLDAYRGMPLGYGECVPGIGARRRPDDRSASRGRPRARRSFSPDGLMAKKDEQPTHLKHLQDHAPTVLHHPEEDETILARWVRKGLEKGTTFWLTLAGVVLGLFVLSNVLRQTGSSRPVEAQAWEQLILASGSPDAVKTQISVGSQAQGAVAGWALLRAAEARYQEAFSDLPQNREAALPLLKESQDLFQKAYDQSGGYVYLKALAAMGIARTLEARGDVDGAVEQYRAIVKEFPGNPQAERAQALIEELQKPENIAFYQQFANLKTDEITLPPRGTDIFNLPRGSIGTDSLPDLPGLPDLGGDEPASAMPDLGGDTPATPVVPGTGPIPAPDASPDSTVPAPDLNPPDNTPAPEPAPSPEPAPATSPEAAPSEGSPAPPPNLPANPFPER